MAVESLRAPTFSQPTTSPIKTHSRHEASIRPDGRTAMEMGLNPLIYPIDVIDDLAHGRLNTEQIRMLMRIHYHDFSQEVWGIENEQHVRDAADYIALGGRVFHPFGNILALTGHPDDRAVRHANIVKGREQHKTGSVTTVPEHFAAIFDTKHPLMPDELRGDTFIELMQELYSEIGPFGVRGPASTTIQRNYSMITEKDGPLIQTQLIAVGKNCPSHSMLRQSIQKRIELGEDPEKATIFFITSANLSSNLTGEEEPAHWFSRAATKDLHPLGIPILGYESQMKEEEVFLRQYPHLIPNSTSILSLHKVNRFNNSPPALVLERYGSAEPELVLDIVARYGFDISIGPGAQRRLKTRQY